jgi:hypothetical protein
MNNYMLCLLVWFLVATGGLVLLVRNSSRFWNEIELFEKRIKETTTLEEAENLEVALILMYHKAWNRYYKEGVYLLILDIRCRKSEIRCVMGRYE